MAFPTRLLGCQGGKGLAFPHPPRRLEQPRGSTWGLRGGPSPLCPGPGSGSQASPPPRPAPPRPAFRRIPSRISAPEPPGGSGLPGSLAPPRGEARRRGRGLALQPRPLRRPPTAWDPGLYAQVPGTLPKQRTASPRIPESPSHPAAAETPRTPRCRAGRVGVGRPAGRAAEGARYSRGRWGRGRGVLLELGKRPQTTQPPPKTPTDTVCSIRRRR